MRLAEVRQDPADLLGVVLELGHAREVEDVPVVFVRVGKGGVVAV